MIEIQANNHFAFDVFLAILFSHQLFDCRPHIGAAELFFNLALGEGYNNTFNVMGNSCAFVFMWCVFLPVVD